jgi:hypothetical protein
VAVTTDPDFFEENPESLEFWTPGSPAFPQLPPAVGEVDRQITLRELLRS